MAGFNLARNAKVFFTSNLAADKTINTSGIANTNTYEVQVLNGFSFSQNTESQTITVAEAGFDPARGQRTFNTALAPVEFSFTTYIRPRNSAGITCEEKYLWNALLSDVNIDATGIPLTVSAIARTGSTNSAQFTFTSANLSTFKVGEVITLKGVVDTANPKDWNNAAKIVSATPAAAADGSLSTTTTVLTVEYLMAPGGTGNPTSTTGTVTVLKSAVSQQTAGTAHLLIHSGRSNKNQLASFGLIANFDDQTYFIQNCSMNQASIDFGLDGIAQIQWTGSGTAIALQASYTTAAAGNFSGGVTGTYLAGDTNAAFITNKLTTVSLSSNLRGISGTAYTLAITGGNITINNNIQYVTPEILAVVNKPIGYFTGTRAISGNLTAYLKTGTTKTAGLLSALLTANPETKFSAGIQIGGSTNATRVDVDLPGITLQIPTIETQDVISTTINFTAQTFDGSTSAAGGGTAAYDLETTNDLFVRYYSA